jgi:hypothetical protein
MSKPYSPQPSFFTARHSEAWSMPRMPARPAARDVFHLKHAQKLYLYGTRHSADLLRKSSAAVGHLNNPGRLLSAPEKRQMG